MVYVRVTRQDIIICGPEGKPGPDRRRKYRRYEVPLRHAASLEHSEGSDRERDARCVGRPPRSEEYKKVPQLTRKRVHVETMESRCARRDRQVNSYQGRSGRRAIPVADQLKKGAIEIPILQSLSMANGAPASSRRWLLTRKGRGTIHIHYIMPPCRHGYGRVDRLPFSLLPRRQLPS